MTKSELIRSVAEKADLTRDEAARAVNAMCATITEGLADGERVALSGFGTFNVHPTAPRVIRHPRTGSLIRVGAGQRVSFRPARSLKRVMQLVTRRRAEGPVRR
jgi:DNA-binding protein HU-beta